MNVKLTGTITKVGDLQEFTGTDFVKKEIVMRVDEPNGQYEQEVPIEFVKDNISLADPLGVGDKVTIDCNLRGNEYNGRYYMSLSAWRTSGLSKYGAPQSNAEPTQAPPAEVTQAPAAQPADNSTGPDNLPF
jgi:hypothetical protein